MLCLQISDPTPASGSTIAHIARWGTAWNRGLHPHSAGGCTRPEISDHANATTGRGGFKDSEGACHFEGDRFRPLLEVEAGFIRFYRVA